MGQALLPNCAAASGPAPAAPPVTHAIPGLWRGHDLARTSRPGIATGYASLDAELPGGGWPAGALTEVLHRHAGIGEVRLFFPALCALARVIAALLKAHERDEFIAAVRALDRVLMSGFYVVPLYHLPAQWVARWTTIAHPPETSLFGYLPETWWREPSK